jgi:peptide/nickel transport system permease protein
VPVARLLADAAPVTLAYLVPSLVLATLLGLLGGLYRSVGEGPPAWLAGGAVHFWVALPTFLGGVLTLRWLQHRGGVTMVYDPAFGPFAGPNLPVVALATAFTALGLGAAQARYVHAETAEYVGMDFVKTLRAGGAPRLALARHLLRNALVPLLSLVVTQTLTTLVLTVFVVEFVFVLPGLGDLALDAIRSRNDRVVVGLIVVTVLVAAAGDLFQDVAGALLDPRVTEE